MCGRALNNCRNNSLVLDPTPMRLFIQKEGRGYSSTLVSQLPGWSLASEMQPASTAAVQLLQHRYSVLVSGFMRLLLCTALPFLRLL